jgi:Domain of unknown function (DUF4124)
MRVRYHLLTKHLSCWLICFGLLSLKGVAFAQVYKSYDADGNVIFSDKPTQRSQEVDITKPNVSDSFEIPPPPPAEPPLETKPEAKSEPEPVTQPIADHDPADTNNDGRVSGREKEEQRKQRRKKKRAEAKAAEDDKE